MYETWYQKPFCSCYNQCSLQVIQFRFLQISRDTVRCIYPQLQAIKLNSDPELLNSMKKEKVLVLTAGEDLVPQHNANIMLGSSFSNPQLFFTSISCSQLRFPVCKLFTFDGCCITECSISIGVSLIPPTFTSDYSRRRTFMLVSK